MLSDRLRLRQVRSTTPFRLTLLLGMLFLASLWGTLSLGYLLTARELTARSDQILFARANSLQTLPADMLPERIRAQIAASATGFSYFALVGADGELVTGNIRLLAPPKPGRPFDLPAQAGRHGPLRVLTEQIPSGETIILARDTSQIRDLRRRLLSILAISGAAGSALTLAIATALSLAPLRRVRDFERASRAVGSGDFSVRMPITGRHDELDLFAATVNLMMDEVVRVVAQVKTATDAIAHDLRTPLTRVRAALGRARHGDGLPLSHGIALDGAVTDLDAVIGRFAALLRVSELETAGRRSGLRRITLAPLLEELADLWAPAAEDNGVTLGFAIEDAEIEADQELLFEAIGNLIDNAIKFARSAVLVRTKPHGATVLLEVTDDGQGIPVDERKAVLRRFHRARGAAGVEGTGLGLALVNAVVHLHGFALELDDAAPGLVVRITMGRPA